MESYSAINKNEIMKSFIEKKKKTGDPNVNWEKAIHENKFSMSSLVCGGKG